METRFYLHIRKSAKTGEQAIYAEIRSPWLKPLPGKRPELRLYTGYSCLAGNFNKDAQKVNKEQTGAKVINNHLRRLEVAVSERLEAARVARQPLTHDELRKMVLEEVRPEAVKEEEEAAPKKGENSHKKPVTFRDWFNVWAKNNRTEVGEKHISHGENVVDHLESFFEGPFTPNEVTEAFVADYKAYLADEEDILDSTANKHIGFIRSVLSQAGISTSEKWLKTRRSKRSRGVVFEKEEQQKIRTLDIEKLPKDLLAEVDKEGNPVLGKDGKPKPIKKPNEVQRRRSLALARDLMLFMFKTGPRHSDLKNLEKSDVRRFSLENGQEIQVLEYFPIKYGKKKDEPCRVALDPEALSIIERYAALSSKLLPVPSNQKLNDALKDVARLAGVDTPIKKVRYKGGKRMESLFPKWKLASCHRCRATCATNLSEGGASARTVQDVLGHEDPRTTQIYITNSDREQFANTLAALNRLSER